MAPIDGWMFANSGAHELVAVRVGRREAGFGEQPCGVGEVAGRQPVFDRGGGIVAFLMPPRGRGMDRAGAIGIAGVELVAQHRAELRLVPVQAVLVGVARHEHVVALELTEELGRVGASGHVFAQNGRERRQARGLHEEALHTRGLRGEHLLQKELPDVVGRRSAGPVGRGQQFRAR